MLFSCWYQDEKRSTCGYQDERALTFGYPDEECQLGDIRMKECQHVGIRMKDCQLTGIRMKDCHLSTRTSGWMTRWGLTPCCSGWKGAVTQCKSRSTQTSNMPILPQRRNDSYKEWDNVEMILELIKSTGNFKTLKRYRPYRFFHINTCSSTLVVVKRYIFSISPKKGREKRRLLIAAIFLWTFGI